jgi:hypothetical protein
MCVGYARVVISVGFVGTRHHSIDTCEMIEIIFIIIIILILSFREA